MVQDIETIGIQNTEHAKPKFEKSDIKKPRVLGFRILRLFGFEEFDIKILRLFGFKYRTYKPKI